MKIRSDFVSNSSSSSYIISLEDNPHMMVLNNPDVFTLRELIDKFGRRLFGLSFSYNGYANFEAVEVTDDSFIEMFLDDRLESPYIMYSTLDKEKQPIYLPHDAVKLFKLLRQLRLEYNSDMFSNMNKAVFGKSGFSGTELNGLYNSLIEATEKAIDDACYRVLATKLDSMRFCYQEIEDGYHGRCLDDDAFKLSIDPDKPSRRDRKVVKVDDVFHDRTSIAFYEPLEYENDESLINARIKLIEKMRGPMKFKRIYSNH